MRPNTISISMNVHGLCFDVDLNVKLYRLVSVLTNDRGFRDIRIVSRCGIEYSSHAAETSIQRTIHRGFLVTEPTELSHAALAAAPTH